MRSFRSWFVAVSAIALLALVVLANAASAGEAYCDACKGDSGWSGAAKLDEIGNPNAGKTESTSGLSTAQKNRIGIWKKSLSGFDDQKAAEENSSTEIANVSQKDAEKKVVKRTTAPQNATIVRSEKAREMLAAIDEVSDEDILLDISEEASEHIQGSIAVPYNLFLNGTAVKSEEEVAKILGDAGITRDDSVVIYGECMPCGGGPAPAAFIYWIMKSLGHEKVRVMDGTVNDWAAAEKPIASDPAKMPLKTYASELRPEFAATYDLVKSGSAQVVDARSVQEFGAGSIPGSINIPSDSVVSNNRIRDETRLEKIFSVLNKNQPIVVFTNTGLKGSVVWFALELLGYDAKLYSYENYLKNQSASNQTTLTNSSD